MHKTPTWHQIWNQNRQGDLVLERMSADKEGGDGECLTSSHAFDERFVMFIAASIVCLFAFTCPYLVKLSYFLGPVLVFTLKTLSKNPIQKS